MSKNQSHSSYWMDDELWDDEEENLSKEELSIHRVARLATTRRAISNFVNILTNRNDITVRYSSGRDSYTTGNDVVIAADDNPENFDVMVGLALHEASHVLLSDFRFLKTVDDVRKQLLGGTDYIWMRDDIRTSSINDTVTVTKNIVHPLLAKILPTFLPSNYLTGPTPEELKYRKQAHKYLTDLMDIMNILEDRRIDSYVYKNAGGYRPYYDSLYSKYFLGKEIGNNLKWNPRWRELTVENYINRVLFTIHPDSNPDSMPGLRKLIQIMDLQNIERVAPENPKTIKWDKNPQYDWMPQIWQVANEIYVHILRFVAMAENNRKQQSQSGQRQESQNGSSGSGSSQNSEDFNEQMPSSEEVENATRYLPNLDVDRNQFSQQNVDSPDKTKKGKDKPVRYNEKRAEKAKKTAKDLMAGKVKKKKASRQEINSVEALEKADAKMVDISGDGVPGGQCMVTRKMSEKLLGEDWFIFGSRAHSYYGDSRKASLAQGRRMGAILEHRLQVRNDPIFTKFTRLPKGNIDRRLLANLGMDITNVFNKSKVDTFKPAMLHLTLDASGSMSGKKWEKVMVVATALAYVGSKVRNIDTVISVRGGSETAIVSIVFDSRKDKFVNWMRWAQKLNPNGATPEGLCYKATMELILECKNTHDVYFINFSDGEPSFYVSNNTGTKRRRRSYVYNSSTAGCSYSGDLAYKHTRAQINNLKDNGVKILSYFISEYTSYGNNNQSVAAFRKMYGEDAAFVNVENAQEVLRTLNKLLLDRG